MAQTANTVFRDFTTEGVPSSGAHNPKKADIREWGAYVEQLHAAAQAGGGVVFQTQAAMTLGYAANQIAWVISDPTAANNGIYQKQGASGAGSWVRVGDLPYSFIRTSNAGAGAANAIAATTSIPVPQADGAALITVNIVADNTASPVTVSFNGGAPLTVKTNSGNDVAPGGLVAGMQMLGTISGATFRLVSDQASSAVVASAEAAADRAEAAALSVESPVSYAPQALTQAQQEQVRANIGVGSPIDSAVTLTVGAGGNYATIREALAAISLRPPLYDNNGIAVRVLLLNGFVMREQVLLRDCDLSHVTIASEAAEVTIDRSSLTINFSAAYPAFGVNNGRLPNIGALFSMNTAGDGDARDGVLATYCSDVIVLPGCGVKNAGRHGLYVSRSSRAQAQNTIWSGAKEVGVYARWGSTVTARDGSGGDEGGAKANNCGVTGFRAEETSTIEAILANANNSGGSGFVAIKSSRINAEGSSANGCVSHGYHAGQCSALNAANSSAIGVGGSAYFSTENSDINAQGAVGTGAGDKGLYALRAARINGNAANVSGAGIHGCLCAQGSTINAAGTNGQRGGTPGATDFRVESGGIINLAGNSTGGVSTPKNAITNNGIIFQP